MQEKEFIIVWCVTTAMLKSNNVKNKTFYNFILYKYLLGTFCCENYDRYFYYVQHKVLQYKPIFIVGSYI